MKRCLLAMVALALLSCAPSAARAQDEGVELAPSPEDSPSDEVNQMFARMDSNRDGELSLEEFEKGIARPYGADGGGVVYQRLPARFRALDVDESGYIEAGEYAQLLQHWRGPGEAPELAAADRNGDGRIDFREFAAMHVPHDADAGDSAADAPPADANAEPAPGTSGRIRSPHARKGAPLKRIA